MAVDCSEMDQLIADLALAHGARPEVKNLDDVHEVLKKDFPQLLRDQISSALVNASKRTVTARSELSQKLSALKSEARKDVYRSDPAARLRFQKQIAELSQKLATDVSPKAKAPEIPMSKELETLAYQRDRLRGQINQKINDLKPKTVFQTVRQPFDASRALITSFDLSMPLRQGSPLVLGHPLRSAPAMRDMFRALASDQAAHKISMDIVNHPAAPLAKRAGLKLTEYGGVEEAYQSKWVEKIPGIRASGRAATVFMNKLRIDAFDSMTKTLARNGEPTLEESKAIANYINVATGKANLGSMEPAANALNSVFFAPKYVASRFQLLAGQPAYRGTMRTRGLIAQEYARYAIGMATVLALGAAAGGTVEKDPRSADFLKVRFGNTRLDPMAGLSQVAVLAGRLATGQTKSTETDDVSDIRGDVKYGKPNGFDIMSKFIRTKFSPLVSTPIDVLSGEDVSGKPVTLAGEAQRMVVPLAMSDVYQSIQDQGVPKGTALGILGMFGMGLQTYQDRDRKAPKGGFKAKTGNPPSN